MSGALRGIKVLDFSTLLPGPMATLFLAEAGAEVIKVERPEAGEDMRGFAPRWGSSSVNFSMLNRGKKSIALDLKDPSDKKQLEPLLREVDVIVEQFRPGVMKRLGLDYESVKKINPKVIYCSISGFGQDGPKRGRAGHDINYVGDAGLLSLACGTVSQPVVPPALIADIGGGSYPAIMNILLALRERDLSGEGAYIDISMTDGVLPFLYWAIGQASLLGKNPDNGGDLVTGGSPRYQLYPTRDGKFVAAGPLETKFWFAFAAAIGLADDFIDDGKDPAQSIVEVRKIIVSRDSDYWETVLSDADCCCTIVKSVTEALADAQFRDRGVLDHLVENESGEQILATPVPIAPFLRIQGKKSRKSPQLGEHNEELLG